LISICRFIVYNSSYQTCSIFDLSYPSLCRCTIYLKLTTLSITLYNILLSHRVRHIDTHIDTQTRTQASDTIPMNFAFTGKGNTSAPEGLRYLALTSHSDSDVDFDFESDVGFDSESNVDFDSESDVDFDSESV
jgi:hypothetical protein